MSIGVMPFSRAIAALAGTAGSAISGGRTSASWLTSTPKNFESLAALRRRVWNCGEESFVAEDAVAGRGTSAETGVKSEKGGGVGGVRSGWCTTALDGRDRVRAVV